MYQAPTLSGQRSYAYVMRAEPGNEKALYTWGQAVGAGGQSWVSSALYCSVRPAEGMRVCSRGLSSVRP